MVPAIIWAVTLRTAIMLAFSPVGHGDQYLAAVADAGSTPTSQAAVADT